MNNSATNKSLLVLQFNANGLKNHVNILQNVLYDKRIDIALITETHFTKYTHIFIPGYQLIKANHPDNTAHGGAAIFVKNSIHFQPLTNYCFDYIQSCTIIVKLNNIPITVGAFYSPPRHNISNATFTDYFNTIKSNFIIGGDFNAKHNAWGCRANNPRGIVLYNFVNTNNFNVLAPPGPTYWPSSPAKKPDILDIFVTKIPSNLHCLTNNILDLNSDHSSVILNVSATVFPRVEPPRLFSPLTDRLEFQNILNQRIDLKIKLKSNHDIDEAVNNLTMLIQSAAWEATKPNKTHNSKNNHPIVSDQIRCLIVEKRRARAKYQATRLPSHKTAYNKLANSLKKALAKYKSYEFEQKLHSLSVTDGSLWRETKRLLKYKTVSPPLLNADNSLAVSDAEKAEVFQAHLSKTFYPHEDIHIPQHIIDVENFLRSTLPSARPEKYFTPNEVKRMISNCSRKKSPGFDLITANVANCLPNKAIILLTYIYNAILRLSYFPTLWKFSQIIMFVKPDKPPDLPTSYRPISLLPYFSKICERLILKRIYPHIISKNVLPSSQFGFRAKHSTVHQVHRVIDAISTSLENKCYCTCAFLDISQAFDKVWHEGLLFKLRKFLPPTLFLLMESYLTNRHFQIRQGSATSNIATICAGVPQGGVLSPILFNIYAADQPSTQNTIVADYADDKVILSVHNDPLIASRNLQSHLNLLSEWYAKWKIKLNNNKSIHTTFTLRHGLCPNVTVNNLPIPAFDTVKYLGLNLDKRLTWQNHIRKKRLILNARSRSLKILLSKNKFSSLKTKLQIYKSLLKPIWTYGIQLWGSAKKSNLNKIQAFQNITLRKITNAPPFVSNMTLHKDLGIKTVEEEAAIFYKRFYNKLENHENPLIKGLHIPSLPGNPRRRLKRKWCRDHLT